MNENTVLLDPRNSVTTPRLPKTLDVLSAHKFINSDLEHLIGLYKYWLFCDTYFLLKKTIGTYDPKVVYVKRRVAKRGNANYVFNTQMRVNKFLDKLPQKIFFNPRDRSRYQKTKLLWITLTTNPRFHKSRLGAWLTLADDLNLFVSNLKSHFSSRILICRSFECVVNADSEALGYPHIHVLAYLSDAEADLFFHQSANAKTGRLENTWRYTKKRDLESYWERGTIDVQGISQISGFPDPAEDSLEDTKPEVEKSVLYISYIVKYLMKNVRKKPNRDAMLLNAIMWALKMRPYALSSKLTRLIARDVTDDLISLELQFKFLEKDYSVTYKFLGIFPFCLNTCGLYSGGCPPPDCPYRRDNDGLRERCPSFDFEAYLKGYVPDEDELMRTWCLDHDPIVISRLVDAKLENAQLRKDADPLKKSIKSIGKTLRSTVLDYVATQKKVPLIYDCVDSNKFKQIYFDYLISLNPNIEGALRSS